MYHSLEAGPGITITWEHVLLLKCDPWGSEHQAKGVSWHVFAHTLNLCFFFFLSNFINLLKTFSRCITTITPPPICRLSIKISQSKMQPPFSSPCWCFQGAGSGGHRKGRLPLASRPSTYSRLRFAMNISLDWAVIDFQIWPRPYVVQKTQANQSDARVLFPLAESGWK